MSYIPRSPCQKYSDKQSSKEEFRKSLSATKFVPFMRRPSDTTSESGSDDFKMDMMDDNLSSSFSRSSSDSYTAYALNQTSPNHHLQSKTKATARYKCISDLKDLSESTSDKIESENYDKNNNETLNDFRLRMASRRKIQTRYQDSQDDEKTDNSCDSTTLKAHKEILRNANLLKQEQISTNDSCYGNNQMKSYHHREIQSYKLINNNQNDNDNSQDQDADLEENVETILMNEFDAILTMEENKMNDFNDDVFQPASTNEASLSVSAMSKSIARSKTAENILAKKNDEKKSTASPRFRRKTQMLKAASSIPSLIFPNKNSKPKSTSTTPTSTIKTFDYNALCPPEKFNNDNDMLKMKKSSIDEDVFTISVTKARRSPLRILGNLVDDKIFRGRWSQAKRAKSTDEITWALANEEAMSNNNTSTNITPELRKRSLSSKPTNRKKSFGGFLSSSNTDSNNNSLVGKQYKNLSDKIRNNFDTNELNFNQTNAFNATNNNSNTKSKTKLLSKRKPSNSSSYSEQIFNNLSDSSSLNSSLNANDNLYNNKQKFQSQQQQQQMQPTHEIKAETLAEIEAFEKMLETHLQENE